MSPRVVTAPPGYVFAFDTNRFRRFRRYGAWRWWEEGGPFQPERCPGRAMHRAIKKARLKLEEARRARFCTTITLKHGAFEVDHIPCRNQGL